MRRWVYISGAISGTAGYLERFNAAEEMLKEEGYAVVNPAKILDNMPKESTHKDYMDVAFVLLDKCDAIYMLPDWRESRGACMEYGFAIGHEMDILGAV